ncbi:hypothetical protein M949_0975 [Riemerella anatipestifer CH3]|nr:hypothetical protein M949_0975 [Riemerella anatipestifer CH3]
MVFFPKAQQLPFVSWEAFDTLRLSQSRNTLVFVHTDWCSVCKKQIKDLEQAPSLLRLLSERVYLLDLNAEKEKRSLSFLVKSTVIIPVEAHQGYTNLRIIFRLAAKFILCGYCWIKMEVS